MKPVIWLGNSKADLKAFPASARDDVLHCFRRKSAKTAREDIELARQRLTWIPRRTSHG
jgi:phage-related protein